MLEDSCYDRTFSSMRLGFEDGGGAVESRCQNKNEWNGKDQRFYDHHISFLSLTRPKAWKKLPLRMDSIQLKSTTSSGFHDWSKKCFNSCRRENHPLAAVIERISGGRCEG